MTSPADLVAWDTGEHVTERAAALEALASLPERDAEVLTLVTWHGLDPREAAAVLGCSPRAFTAALHRARKRLARALRAANQAPPPAANQAPPPAAASRPGRPPGGRVPPHDLIRIEGVRMNRIDDPLRLVADLGRRCSRS